MDPRNESMQDDLVHLLAARRGHFKLESGHHGDLWLDLDPVFLRPGRVRPFAVELARRLSTRRVEAVCGPLTGGAFVAQMVATELDVEFYYAEAIARPQSVGMYPVEYRIPEALRAMARGKRVAVVDDVVNAGSAVRSTLADLKACGAKPVAIGALLVLGSTASSFAAGQNLPLESISQLPNALWEPSECPLCASRVTLEDPARPSW